LNRSVTNTSTEPNLASWIWTNDITSQHHKSLELKLRKWADVTEFRN